MVRNESDLARLAAAARAGLGHAATSARAAEFLSATRLELDPVVELAGPGLSEFDQAQRPPSPYVDFWKAGEIVRGRQN